LATELTIVYQMRNDKTNRRTPTLKELYQLRDKVKVELLGQEDPEYRQEVENLLEAVKKKIVEVLEAEEAQELESEQSEH
jgi:flagellar basal body-associated protein FliL